MKNTLVASIILFAFLFFSCASIEFDRQYKVGKGEDFVINLKSNPSTGYLWKIEEGLSDSVVTVQKEEYEPDKNPSDKPRVGAGGTKKWHILANRKGKTVLKFVYKKPGTDETGEIKYFQVRVK